MSLMEHCEIREGRFVPSYREILAPILCEWCEEEADSVAQTGANMVCPECIGKMRGAGL